MVRETEGARLSHLTPGTLLCRCPCALTPSGGRQLKTEFLCLKSTKYHIIYGIRIFCETCKPVHCVKGPEHRAAGHGSLLCSILGHVGCCGDQTHDLKFIGQS